MAGAIQIGNDGGSKMKKFGLERILTISADEYCRAKGKCITQYEFRGICVNGFEAQVSDNTEVIIAYRPGGRFNGCGIGTALIPKDTESSSSGSE